MNINTKIKESVYKNISNKINFSKAYVISYDAINNVAKIYIDPTGTGNGSIIENVPVFSINGIHSGNLQHGDDVYVAFANNSISNPKIVARADETYAYNTRIKERHIRKGELIVTQAEEDGEITSPSSESWLDDENRNVLKSGFFFDKSAITDADTEMFAQGTFSGQDVGIYSPTSSSIIKISENGTINIFTETNTGLKINPKDKTIQMLGNDLYTKFDNWSIVGTNINITADETVNIKAKAININAKEINKGDYNNV